MKKLLYPLAFALTAFLFVYSCSTDEDDAPPPAAIVKKYTLAVTAGEGGTVSSSGGTYSQGTQVSITAAPKQEKFIKFDTMEYYGFKTRIE